MANLGGGAEAHARFKQYEYRANSSLVLTSENRPRDTHEPTGEPETLWGKIDPKSFGDRVAKGSLRSWRINLRSRRRRSVMLLRMILFLLGRARGVGSGKRVCSPILTTWFISPRLRRRGLLMRQCLV
ncbi:unnamed protein product [Brassica napus]|uniref:(rape) hypothetical protein n=1 Tax=Brassica napus TaxID=3708 RepID=A0A816M6U1_BRANA|nr:unnamed protein product [Brassica napus]